jgi:hypothetical protein
LICVFLPMLPEESCTRHADDLCLSDIIVQKANPLPPCNEGENQIFHIYLKQIERQSTHLRKDTAQWWKFQALSRFSVFKDRLAMQKKPASLLLSADLISNTGTIMGFVVRIQWATTCKGLEICQAPRKHSMNLFLL